MGLRTLSMTARLQNTNESCIEVALGFREPSATFFHHIHKNNERDKDRLTFMRFYNKANILFLALFISAHTLVAEASTADITIQERLLQQQEQKNLAKEADEESRKRSQEKMVRLKEEKETLSHIKT